MGEMAADEKLIQDLQDRLQRAEEELEENRYRLEEANEMIDAIRSGEVDGLVVKANDTHKLYTLKNADQAYRIFIEQMISGAVTLNRSGEIMYSNSRFAALLGMPLEKVTGNKLALFIDPECLTEFEVTQQEAWSAPSKTEFKLKSGNCLLPVLISMQTLDLEEGLSMSMIITDLSEQKRQQQLLTEKNNDLEKAQAVARELNLNLERTVQERTKELFENQERLSMILETMAEGVGIIDLNGNLTYANPMAQQILGLKQSDILERTYDDPKWQNLRVDGSPLPGHEHPMAITMTTGKPVFDHEISVQPPGAERFYISINAAPIKNQQGEIIAGIGTFMDVTNRRKVIQQKDEFISVASHELKTPVTSLKASLQLLEKLKNDLSQPLVPRLIEQANRSLNKLSTLIDDLLDATKVTDGRLPLNLSEFNLAVLVNEYCQDIRLTENVHLEVSGDPEIILRADRQKIGQVLLNLINNAIKYAPGSNKITVHFGKEDAAIKVVVTDQGAGIAPEKLKYLFQRYYQVNAGGKQYSGLGLGLYICAEIIRQHSGQIGVDSRPGEGSAFWFTLPLFA